MRKTKLLNSILSYEISKMGHFDTIAIADAGLPIPRGIRRIDLAVSEGIPDFMSVLEAVLRELKVQKATVAAEMQDNNPALFKTLNSLMQKEGAAFTAVPHEDFKIQTTTCVAVVRTGEMKPYANIILESGVVF